MIRCLWLLGLTICASRLNGDDSTPNTLSDAERAAGWRLLFDGKATTGWRGFKKNAFPTEGWRVEEGCLCHGPRGGGDIITTEKFDDYEFSFEWKIDADANSGVKYFITEERESPIGHEYQLMGPRTGDDAPTDMKHATASFYDVLPAGTNALPRAPGEWNQSRIVVRGNHVEHWLNQARVLAYELGSEPVLAGIATSKFKSVRGFGSKFPHPLLLQDHPGNVWFRSLKLLPLKP